MRTKIKFVGQGIQKLKSEQDIQTRFCCCDLDLDLESMTLTYKLDLDILKI